MQLLQLTKNGYLYSNRMKLLVERPSDCTNVPLPHCPLILEETENLSEISRSFDAEETSSSSTIVLLNSTKEFKFLF